MKCSDCKLFKTDECKNNPEAKDLDYAESCSRFEAMAEQEPTHYVYTKRPAIASLVIGILTIVLLASSAFFATEFGIVYTLISAFLGLVGIVVGAIYLKITSENPNPSGKAMAIIGIIIGSIGFLGGLALAVIVWGLEALGNL